MYLANIKWHFKLGAKHNVYNGKVPYSRLTSGSGQHHLVLDTHGCLDVATIPLSR
jgi:hypothetical protein